MLPPSHQAHLLLPEEWVHAQHLLNTWLYSIQLDLQMQTKFLRSCLVDEQEEGHSLMTAMALLSVDWATLQDNMAVPKLHLLLL